MSMRKVKHDGIQRKWSYKLIANQDSCLPQIYT